MENNLKCVCDRCGGLLEFAATDAGAEVECPLCQQTTVLRGGDAGAGGGGAPRSGRSRKVLLVVAGIVLAVSGVGAGAAFFIKQKGAKAVKVEAPRTEPARVSKAAEPTREDDASAKPVVPVLAAFQAGFSAAQIREGRDLFYWKCSECHHLYDVSIYGDKQWDTVFGNMRGKAKLNGAQAQAIATFVRSIREP